MSRWLLTLLALSAVTVAVVLAIARPGALSRPGTFAQPVAAVAGTQPSPTPAPYADIDKIPDGDGWCNPVQNQSTEVVGTSHKLAVCVHNMPEDVGGFDLTISYDDTLDSCTETNCTEGPCLNDNPDANAGLGQEWNCRLEGHGQPMCHQLQTAGDGLSTVPGPSGRATINCEGDGTIKEGALAVLNLDVIAAGTDNVGINWLVVYNAEATPIAHCQYNNAGGFGMTCLGATDIKQSGETHKRATLTPTPEPPTATPVPPTVPPPPPPPTATPSGGVGPQIVGPATGSGPTDSGAPWAIWLAVAGTAAAAGGFYLRFAKGQRRGSG